MDDIKIEKKIEEMIDNVVGLVGDSAREAVETAVYSAFFLGSDTPGHREPKESPIIEGPSRIPKEFRAPTIPKIVSNRKFASTREIVPISDILKSLHVADTEENRRIVVGTIPIYFRETNKKLFLYALRDDIVRNWGSIETALGVRGEYASEKFGSRVVDEPRDREAISVGIIRKIAETLLDGETISLTDFREIMKTMEIDGYKKYVEHMLRSNYEFHKQSNGLRGRNPRYISKESLIETSDRLMEEINNGP